MQIAVDGGIPLSEGGPVGVLRLSVGTLERADRLVAPDTQPDGVSASDNTGRALVLLEAARHHHSGAQIGAVLLSGRVVEAGIASVPAAASAQGEPHVTNARVGCVSCNNTGRRVLEIRIIESLPLLQCAC